MTVVTLERSETEPKRGREEPEYDSGAGTPPSFYVVFTDFRYVPKEFEKWIGFIELKGRLPWRKSVEYTALIGTNLTERNGRVVTLDGPISVVHTSGVPRYSELYSAFFLYPRVYGTFYALAGYVAELGNSLRWQEFEGIENKEELERLDSELSDDEKGKADEWLGLFKMEEQDEEVLKYLQARLVDGTVQFPYYGGVYSSVYDISDDAKAKLSHRRVSKLMDPVDSAAHHINIRTKNYPIVLPTISKSPFPYAKISLDKLQNIFDLIKRLDFRGYYWSSDSAEASVNQLDALMEELFHDGHGNPEQFIRMNRSLLPPEYQGCEILTEIPENRRVNR